MGRECENFYPGVSRPVGKFIRGFRPFISINPMSGSRPLSLRRVIVAENRETPDDVDVGIRRLYADNVTSPPVLTTTLTGVDRHGVCEQSRLVSIRNTLGL